MLNLLILYTRNHMVATTSIAQLPVALISDCKSTSWFLQWLSESLLDNLPTNQLAVCQSSPLTGQHVD